MNMRCGNKPPRPGWHSGWQPGLAALWLACLLTVPATAQAPAAPSGLTVTAAGVAVNNFTIHLAWTDNSTNESGFRIERKIGTGSFSEIATVGAGVTAFDNTVTAGDTLYSYQVRAYNGSGNSAYSNTAAVTTLNPPGSQSTGPGAGQQAETVYPATMHVFWWDNSAYSTGFEVWRAQLDGSVWTDWVRAATVADTSSGNGEWDDTGRTPGKSYRYKIRAFNANSTSIYSWGAYQTMPALPAAPAASAATGITQTGFTANWSQSTGATRYFLDVSTSSGFSSYVSGYQKKDVGNVLTYAVTPLNSGITYYYRVRAANNAGDSGVSGTVTAVTVPANPTATAATAVTQTGFSANWPPGVTGATGYYLDVSTASSFATFVTGYQNKSVGNVLTSAVTGLTPGTTYYYRVRSANGSGTSGNSNTITVTTLPPVPAAPSNLTAATASTTQINLAWTDGSTNETSFKVERKTGAGGSWGEIVSLAANTVNYSNTGLTANTTYYYRVRAYNAAGYSAYSNEASAFTGPPAAPSSLTAVTASTTQINLAWTDGSTNETSFKVERKTGAGGTWGEIVSLAANTVNYSNTGLTANTTYYYRVRAYNAAGYSAYGNEASATTSLVPGAPSDLAAAAAPGGTVTLSWVDNSTNETGFEIERKEGAGNWSKIFTLLANDEQEDDPGRSPGVTYTWRIRAVNAAGNSAWSNEAALTIAWAERWKNYVKGPGGTYTTGSGGTARKPAPGPAAGKTGAEKEKKGGAQ